jgi:hypothetical protein
VDRQVQSGGEDGTQRYAGPARTGCVDLDVERVALGVAGHADAHPEHLVGRYTGVEQRAPGCCRHVTTLLFGYYF